MRLILLYQFQRGPKQGQNSHIFGTPRGLLGGDQVSQGQQLHRIRIDEDLSGVADYLLLTADRAHDA